MSSIRLAALSNRLEEFTKLDEESSGCAPVSNTKTRAWGNMLFCALLLAERSRCHQ